MPDYISNEYYTYRNVQTDETSEDNSQPISSCNYSVTDTICLNKGIGIQCDTSSEAWGCKLGETGDQQYYNCRNGCLYLPECKDVKGYGPNNNCGTARINTIPNNTKILDSRIVATNYGCNSNIIQNNLITDRPLGCLLNPNGETNLDDLPETYCLKPLISSNDTACLYNQDSISPLLSNNNNSLNLTSTIYESDDNFTILSDNKLLYNEDDDAQVSTRKWPVWALVVMSGYMAISLCGWCKVANAESHFILTRDGYYVNTYGMTRPQIEQGLKTGIWPDIKDTGEGSEALLTPDLSGWEVGGSLGFSQPEGLSQRSDGAADATAAATRNALAQQLLHA